MTTLILSWFGGDPDYGDVVKYHLYFGICPQNQQYIGSTLYHDGGEPGPFTYDLGLPLQPGTTYFWKIIAEDSHSVTTESPLWRFTTLEPPNPVPDLDCYGDLSFDYVYPDSTIYGFFTIDNIY